MNLTAQDGMLTSSSRVGEWYDKQYRLSPPPPWSMTTLQAESFLELLNFPKDARGTILLDIGCGLGQLVRAATSRGGLVIGIDISSEARKRTKRSLKSLGEKFSESTVVLNETMESLRFDSDYIDYITAVGSLHNSSKIHHAISEFSRVLKRGGRWAIQVPSPQNDEVRDQPIVRIADLDEWKVMLRAYGDKLNTKIVLRVADDYVICGSKL